MNKIIFLLFIIVGLNANILEIKPEYSFIASSDVQDIVYNDNILYTANLDGKVNIFDFKSKKLINEIKIKNIKDFMGDEVNAKIYSIDVLNHKVLITSQGNKGYINIYLYDLKSNIIKKIIDTKQKIFVRKTKFIDDSTIIIGTLSNEIILYDLDNKKIIYQHQISMSSFSDFSLNEDKSKIATTDESGEIKIHDVRSFKLIKQLKSMNLDKVFQLSYKNDSILTAGQDRKSVIYNNNTSYEYKFDFLLYACALNNNASLIAIAYNENNDVLIIDEKTKKKLFSLISNEAIITKIIFVNKNTIIVSSNDKKINIYRIKK